MASLTSARTLLDALTEDRRAFWVPDVLGWGDAPALVEEREDGWLNSSIEAIESMYYPKPDGSLMKVAVLNMPTLARLHHVTDPLRSAADHALAAGVCGYRRGAEAGWAYSRENLRFHEFSSAEADGAEFVAIADIARFFEHVPWSLALTSSADLWSDEVERRAMERFAHDAAGAGLRSLPAGYADARLLANIVLRKADASIDAPFTRWVDDYRVFAQTEHEARQHLDALRAALALDGLQLNESKTRVVDAKQFKAESGNTLQSVYHPDVESADQVRTALRTVFLAAAAEPVRERRSIRFVLPRMAAQGDDLAVEWALRVLPTMPWEAPRICSYLATFASRSDIARNIERTMIKAMAAGDIWFASRLAALACRTGVSAEAAPRISEELSCTRSAALWGLGVRALALGGHAGDVRRLIGEGVADPRAAAGALIDLDDPDGLRRLHAVPWATHNLLAQGPAPLPELDAIL